MTLGAGFVFDMLSVKVVALELTPGATITVDARIDPDYAHWLRTDSTVSIGKESLVGDNFVAISAGTEHGAPIVDEGRLAFVPGDSLDERIQRIAAQAEQVLGAMQAFVTTLDDPRGELRTSLGDAHALLSGLQGSRGRLDQDLGGVQTTLRAVDRSLAELDAHLGRIEATSGETLQEYRALAVDTRHAMASVDELVRTVQPELQQVLENSAEATAHLDLAVQAARTHWPFKGTLSEHLDPPKPVTPAPAAPEPQSGPR